MFRLPPDLRQAQRFQFQRYARKLHDADTGSRQRKQPLPVSDSPQTAASQRCRKQSAVAAVHQRECLSPQLNRFADKWNAADSAQPRLSPPSAATSATCEENHKSRNQAGRIMNASRHVVTPAKRISVAREQRAKADARRIVHPSGKRTNAHTLAISRVFIKFLNNAGAKLRIK